MSLTTQDLQNIKTLLVEHDEVLLAKVDVLLDRRFEQQAKEFAVVINQVVVVVDGRFNKLEKEVEILKSLVIH